MFPVSLDILKRSLFVSADSIAAKCEQGRRSDGCAVFVLETVSRTIFPRFSYGDFRERPDFFP